MPSLLPHNLLQQNILPAPNCVNSTASLFKIDFENNLVRLDPDRKYWSSSLWNTSKCFYKHLFRIPNKPDFKYLQGTPTILIENATTRLPDNIDHIHVWCNYIATQGMFYEDYLSVVKLKPELEEKLNSINAGEEFYSLLIIGQDSVSHMNFIRTMPKVQDFLINTLEAVEFHGLNALGPITQWNFRPFISGLSLQEFKIACYGASAYLESCPYIWRSFEKQGYRTAYTEDATQQSIFPSFGRHAFLKQPFHYDFRSVDRELGTMRSSEKHCFGSRLSVSVILENMLRVAKAFHNKPYWALMWAQSLSHFDNSLSTYAEPSMLSSLEYLHNNQLLNNTILIMLSDHGIWWRDFQKSKEQAFMEQRLPMFYIVLPKKFREKYPRATKNLQENSNKLVTMFDVHQTMKDILNLKGITEESLKDREKEEFHQTSRNVSLFLPVNPNRTCAMAGISLINCACISRQASSVSDPGVVSAAKSVVKKINYKIRTFPNCNQLALVNISEVYVAATKKRLHSEELQVKDAVNRYDRNNVENTHGEYFEMIIETAPGRGKFYVAVGMNGIDGSISNDGIVRVSMYGNDADCMPVLSLKPYCYCKTNNKTV